jgi:hypothetical protein
VIFRHSSRKAGINIIKIGIFLEAWGGQINYINTKEDAEIQFR